MTRRDEVVKTLSVFAEADIRELAADLYLTLLNQQETMEKMANHLDVKLTTGNFTRLEYVPKMTEVTLKESQIQGIVRAIQKSLVKQAKRNYRS